MFSKDEVEAYCNYLNSKSDEGIKEVKAKNLTIEIEYDKDEYEGNFK